MTREYSYEDVKASIWEVIKDKTDFVYEPTSDCEACTDHNDWEYDPEGYGEDEPPTCNAHHDGDACRYFYADNRGYSNCDTPACVVGNWFTYAQFTPEDLNAKTWEELEGQGVRKIIEYSSLDLDDEAVEFLNYMQTHQDTGISWGNAYELSIAKLEGNGE